MQSEGITNGRNYIRNPCPAIADRDDRYIPYIITQLYIFHLPTSRLMFAIARHSHFVTRRAAQIRRHISTSSMAPLTSWDRLVRYVSAKDGKIRYGEPIVSDSKPDIDQLAQDGKLEVKILDGPNPIEATATGEQDTVKQLLGPLTPKDVPIIRGVGLNYMTHSEYFKMASHASLLGSNSEL